MIQNKDKDRRAAMAVRRKLLKERFGDTSTCVKYLFEEAEKLSYNIDEDDELYELARELDFLRHLLPQWRGIAHMNGGRNAIRCLTEYNFEEADFWAGEAKFLDNKEYKSIRAFWQRKYKRRHRKKEKV